MSVYYSPSSEAWTLANELDVSATPPPISETHASESVLDREGGESNSWVEALLHESSAETLNLGAVRLDTARRLVMCDGRYARFAPLDFALLLVLAKSKNRMLSYARITSQVWGPRHKVSVARLRVRVFRVRQRLEEEHMHAIRILNRGGLGYVMELDAPTNRRRVPRAELDVSPGVSANMTAAGRLTSRDFPRNLADAAE